VEAGGVAALHGVELRYRCRGEGPPVLLLHETAAAGLVWRRLDQALADDAAVIAYDRRGWGESTAPDPYLRTTIEEQAEDAAALLELLDVGPAVLCGAGLGAVAALDLILRRTDLARAAVLVEPPLLAFLPEATEALSADRALIEAAVADGGAAAALELHLGGGLSGLGAGAERVPAEVGAVASRTPLSFFAELGAVSAWSIDGRRLGAAEVPSRIVTGASTPALLERAGEELAARLGRSHALRLPAAGLPHVDGAAELAQAVKELLAPSTRR
jgi:pimeloyl-ACP methyl ester carboxylesterase